MIDSANRGLQELGVPFISISAPSIVSGMSGESEKTLRDTFEEAKVSLFLSLMVLFTKVFASARRAMFAFY